MTPSTQYFLPSLIAIALAGAALPAMAEEVGFVEGAKVNLNLRNFYINRNFTNPTKTQGKAEEWTQSFILDAKSGFTQGTVGFGMDVLGLYSVKLDGGKGTGGTQLLPLDHDGRPADNFGRTNVAFKAKLSQTEVKVGEWMPVLPILRSDDGRSLPQTFRGGQITSKEINGLTLYGGQFRANSPRDDSSMNDMSMTGKTAFTSDRFNFQGGEYAFNGKRTQIGLWNAELKDIYSQQYVNLIHTQPLGDWTFGANLGFFYGKDDGSARAGELDNKTWSGLFSAKYGGNTFYVGLQKNSQAEAPGCGSTAPAAAPWPMTATTPAMTTRRKKILATAPRLQLRRPWRTRPEPDEPLHQRRQRTHRNHQRRQGMGPRKRTGLHRAERHAQRPQRQMAQLNHPPRLQQQRVRREPFDHQLSDQPAVNTDQMWERACSRKRCLSLHQC